MLSGALATCLDAKYFDSLIQVLLTGFDGFVTARREEGVFLTLSGLSKNCSVKFAPYAGRVLTALHRYIEQTTAASVAEAGNTVDRNERRESGLITIDAIIRHCPVAAITHLPSLVPALKVCLSYDPNFLGDENDGSDDATAEVTAEAESGDAEADGNDAEVESEYVDGQSDDEAVDDDDDTSWKVRRAAARSVDAVIAAVATATATATTAVVPAVGAAASVGAASVGRSASRKHASTATRVLALVAPALLSRFNERQRNVQLEVLTAFRLVLTQIKHSAAAHDMYVATRTTAVLLSCYAV